MFSLDVLAAKSKEISSKPLEKVFPHSNKCKRCHLRAYEEWEASAQSRSIETAAFRITLDRYLKSVPDDKRGMCFQCHAPHILEYDHLVSDFIDEVKSKDPQIDGVGCSQCHLISENRFEHPSTASDLYPGENHLWGIQKCTEKSGASIATVRLV